MFPSDLKLHIYSSVQNKGSVLVEPYPYSCSSMLVAVRLHNVSDQHQNKFNSLPGLKVWQCRQAQNCYLHPRCAMQCTHFHECIEQLMVESFLALCFREDYI